MDATKPLLKVTAQIHTINRDERGSLIVRLVGDCDMCLCIPTAHVTASLVKALLDTAQPSDQFHAHVRVRRGTFAEAAEYHAESRRLWLRLAGSQTRSAPAKPYASVRVGPADSKALLALLQPDARIDLEVQIGTVYFPPRTKAPL